MCVYMYIGSLGQLNKLYVTVTVIHVYAQYVCVCVYMYIYTHTLNIFTHAYTHDVQAFLHIGSSGTKIINKKTESDYSNSESHRQ